MASLSGEETAPPKTVVPEAEHEAEHEEANDSEVGVVIPRRLTPPGHFARASDMSGVTQRIGNMSGLNPFNDFSSHSLYSVPSQKQSDEEEDVFANDDDNGVEEGEDKGEREEARHQPHYKNKTRTKGEDEESLSSVGSSIEFRRLYNNRGSTVRQNSNGIYDTSSWRKRMLPAPRLLRRNMLPFYQTPNRVDIDVQPKHHSPLLRLILQDWFHVMLRQNTVWSLLALLGLWTAVIMGFALLYMAVDAGYASSNCGLGSPPNPIAFGPAFAFSLETCTTVGYGLPGSTNAFFENCPTLQLVIYFQMVFSMLFNAFLLAFIYARIGRSERRGYQVLFSHQAIVRREPDGRIILELRVFDADASFPVVEAHVRLYTMNQVDRDRLLRIRTLSPNDDLGGVLFLSIPHVITHHIDIYSPLRPPHLPRGSAVADSGELVLREVDSYTGNRGGYPCPVCGETLGTRERLINHIKYQQLLEQKDCIPVKGSHRSIDTQREFQDPDQHLTLEAVKDFLEASQTEILVVVEGIDPLTSGTFQALHSYRPEELVFGDADLRFEVCFNENHVVDLNKFHAISRKSD